MVAAKILLVDEDVLEEKLTYCFVVILQLQNHSCSSMFTKLHLEVFTRQAKEVQQLVSQFTSLRIRRQKKLYWSLALLYCLTEAFAALMSSTKWMITQGTFFTKRWNNKQYRLQRLESFVLSTLEQQFWPQLTLFNLSTTQRCQSLKTSSFHQLYCPDSI